MPLRIFTANLYSGRANPASFAAALSELEPDIVAIQELGATAAEVLHDWGATRLLDPREDTTGMGLAVAGDADLAELHFPNRNPLRARLDGSRWGFGSLELISAHLVNPIARPLLRSKRLRRLELAALEGLLDEPVETRILVGDLNSSPAWPLYRRLTELATDGAVAAGTARRTWGFYPKAPPLLRIDHAFLQGADCVGTSVVAIDGCDHRGLVVDVEPNR